mgnify:CR=1 FL=1
MGLDWPSTITTLLDGTELPPDHAGWVMGQILAGEATEAGDLAAQGQQEAQPGQDEPDYDQQAAEGLQLAHVLILGRRPPCTDMAWD